MSRLIFFLAAAFACAATLQAQEFPAKPLRIVTSEVGGATDMIARLIAQGMTGSLGHQVVVENRPTGIIPADIVVKAAPDGYTLLVHGVSLWMMPLLQKMPFDPVRDLATITLAASTPSIVAVHPSVAAKNIRELIALAKTRPGALNYASGATGASSHLSAELFNAMADVRIVRIPYRGQGPAVLALLAGEVQVAFATASSVAAHAKSGRMRALAITTAKPSSLAPGVPTVAESGLPGYESASTAGAFAPRATPAKLIALLNREMVRALNRPETKEALFNGGTEVVGSSPQEFAAAMKAEMSRMGKVIRDAGIRGE
jgi:tripartite-type tricarboxylate transporter receptor subunit TctC